MKQTESVIIICGVEWGGVCRGRIRRRRGCKLTNNPSIIIYILFSKYCTRRDSVCHVKVSNFNLERKKVRGRGERNGVYNLFII